MNEQPNDIKLDLDVDLKDRLHAETARIAWRDLQKFFARGMVFWVSDDCDLVETAVTLASDDASQLRTLIESAKIAAVSDDQAREWYGQEAELWSVVVAPYVLVQQRK